jgi:hypothetical protein
MIRTRIFQLIERWDGPKNEYWFGVDPLSCDIHHNGQTLIGPQSKTMEELEKVAANIREDLDQVLAEARIKILAQYL